MNTAAPEFAPSTPSVPSIWWSACRPKTLFAAVVPVVVGTAYASKLGDVHWGIFLLTLLCASLIQIGTNFANDLYDALQGADTPERLGPRRAVSEGWVSVEKMRAATKYAFVSAVVLGAALVFRGGWPIAWIGVASVACGLWYTFSSWSLAYLGIADVFVFVFFGPVAVGGTVWLQVLELPKSFFLLGASLGLLATAILVVNNVRDVDGDTRAAKNTLVVRFGRSFGVRLYAWLVWSAFLCLGLFALRTAYWGVLLAGFALPYALRLRGRLEREVGPSLNDVLAGTGKLLLIVGLLCSVGLLVS